jgi:RHS repeat-associated protein
MPSAGQQTRTFAYDGLGRLTSETNSESGTTQYFYDSAPATPGVACPGTYHGDLVKSYDANGNTSCYTYDGLHRELSATCAGPNYNGVNKYMVYHSATVNGVTMANAKGRLVEAYTAATQGGTKTTDEGISYSVRGELADFYESTPQSGGYYHSAVTFYPNGGLDTLWMPGIPAITYGTLDGEGRPTTVSASSGQNPVTSVSYDNAGGSGRVLGATYGSGDSDTFGYDANTGRQIKYTFTMNGQQEIGNLTWNTNGTLGNLTINDPFNSADNGQNCNYGYDDLARLGSVGCGSSWSQTFTYDPFANITKSGSISWACPSCYDATTNRYNTTLSSSISYDSNGNLKNDTFHSYTWDANNRPVSIDSIGITYDALGRQVEQNQSGTYYQIVYTPQGKKLAVMKGQTIQQAFVPLPGGGTAEYLSWGLSHYRHPDWLGSDRLASSYQKSSTPITSAAYAPFGEPYATSGNGELSFTGANKDTDWLQYDFLARQYDPRQGRWSSPDPAGLAAVDPSNPQTWNRYTYVANDPLAFFDPLGLQYEGHQVPCLNGLTPCYSNSDPNQLHCIMDGADTPCSTVFSTLQNGSAALCPGGNCIFNEHGLFQRQWTPDDGWAWNRIGITSPANNVSDCQAPFLCNPATNNITGTIRAGDPNWKKNYCSHQADMAGLESALPGGSVLLGGDYSPSAVGEDATHVGVEIALEKGAESSGFLFWVRSMFGAPMTGTARWLARGSYAVWGYQAYKGMRAVQKEYAACMER